MGFIIMYKDHVKYNHFLIISLTDIVLDDYWN